MPNTPNSAAPVSRRTVAKGLAWSAPAVGVAGAAPALAASVRKIPGIDGWVSITPPDGSGDSCYETITLTTVPSSNSESPDGAPWGLYLYDTDPDDVYSDASLTFWIAGTQSNPQFTYGRNHSSACWGEAVVGDPAEKPDGNTYTPYTFFYSCPIDPTATQTDSDGQERLYLEDIEFIFNGTQENEDLCNELSHWTERKITLTRDGQTELLTFQRRNGHLGFYDGGNGSQSRSTRGAKTGAA